MTLTKPTKACLCQHSCTGGEGTCDFYCSSPLVSGWKYSILWRPYSGDPLLGNLPTSSNSTCCRAGKWRPEQNALRPKQHFAVWGDPAHQVPEVCGEEGHNRNLLQMRLATPSQTCSASGRWWQQPHCTERRRKRVKSGWAQECHTGWVSGSKSQPAKVQDWCCCHAASSQYFCKPCHAWNVLRFSFSNHSKCVATN